MMTMRYQKWKFWGKTAKFGLIAITTLPEVLEDDDGGETAEDGEAAADVGDVG